MKKETFRFSLLLALALPLVCWAAEIKETRNDGETRFHVIWRKEYGNDEFHVALGAALKPGNPPEYYIYCSSNTATGMNHLAVQGFKVTARSNNYYFGESNAYNRETNSTGRIVESRIFYMTPVQLRDLCREEVATFSIHGKARRAEVISDEGDLGKFFNSVTNAAYRLARDK